MSAIPGIVDQIRRASSSNVEYTAPDVHVARDAEKFINEAPTKELVKWSLVLIGGFVVLKALASAIIMVGALLFPMAYIYMIQTCPAEESFEAKKHLKRVLRGAHLSEDHPEKPKGYFESIYARASASVTAETAVLTGYKQEMTKYGGAAILVCLKIPSKQVAMYWVGALGEWRYVHTRQLNSDAKKSD